MADHSNPCAGCEQSSETRVSVQDKAIRESRSKPPLRVVFMGTPDFAAVIL